MAAATLTPGKVRGLQTAATEAGHFAILAIDHRDSLRVLLDPADDITAFKLDVIRAVGPAASAVMLDPELSAAQAIVAGALPGSVGFLCAVEEQGYFDTGENTLLPDWGVEQVKRLGASAVKLLVIDGGGIDEVVAQVVDDCTRFDIPLFLEPWDVDLDTILRLAAAGPDVLKVQYPGDAASCAALTDTGLPWALLSAGEPFERFRDQLRIACEAGCSGFMAGRALWGQAVDADRAAVLADVTRPRFAELADLVATVGRPWTEAVELPEIGEDWYRSY